MVENWADPWVDNSVARTAVRKAADWAVMRVDKWADLKAMKSAVKKVLKKVVLMAARWAFR